MNSNEIREAFLLFFESKGHRRMPSSSLVPKGDPTLLLTTAGMVQFKPYFTGEAVPPNPRLTSCQKCFRTTDIDSVGDTQHLTFFEMLGNFSIGNYFKKEAIEWAWEFVTQRLKLDPDRLWVTIFTDDDEAFDCWRRIGFPASKIKRFGEKHNFWGPAGDTGPCGPCSEIHYDLGEKVGCGKSDCGPNCECGRFTEIWNLVFTQYDQRSDGSRLPLPKPNIDTGMGLERTAAAMQGVTTVYETDRFAPLIASVARLAGKRYGEDEATDKAMRVVAEHARAVTFLIADGVMPSNEGRGYVLRRVLRRAAVFGKKLELEGFLSELAKAVIDQMKPIYPELKREREFILSTIAAEEGRFEQTLNAGMNQLEELLLDNVEQYKSSINKAIINLQQALIINPLQNLAKSQQELLKQSLANLQQVLIINPLQNLAKSQQELLKQSLADLQQALKTISSSDPAFVQNRADIQKALTIRGETVFRLYDTYGFPLDVTKEIATEHGSNVDIEGFEREMEKQRERARTAQAVNEKVSITENVIHKLAKDLPETAFVGGDCRKLKHRSEVLMLTQQGKEKQTLVAGEEGEIVLSQTPFYGEMGGQVGDSGEIVGTKGRFAVSDTIRFENNVIVHRGKMDKGTISKSEAVTARVDQARRLDIARNHTATHLLQATLRRVLGEHVRQSGSLVSPDYLRFDFSHPKALTAEELSKIQRQVNEWIRQNIKVTPKITSYKEAIEKGALAFFDEKYGDEVRALVIGGRKPVSTELCGGTHVNATGEIGYLHITAESSIGAGMRRIEAVTGRGAETYIDKQLSIIEEAAGELKTEPAQIRSRIEALKREVDTHRKKSSAIEHEASKKNVEALLSEVAEVNGIPVLATRVPAANVEALRRTGDLIKERLRSVLLVLGTVCDGQANFVAMATPDLVKKGLHAGDIVKQVAQVAGGRGGGRAEMGQGGGKDIDRLDDALSIVKGLVAKHGNAGD